MTAPVRRRTRAREIAMQALFQFDLREADYAPEISQTAGIGNPPGGSKSAGSDPTGSAPEREQPPRATRNSIVELCQAEIVSVEGDDEEVDQQLDRKLNRGEREMLEFATQLVEGTLQHRDTIDEKLQSVTRNWDLRRMAVVDRNVLRMAVYELMYCADVPPKVAINEAIEVGKKFSTANSGGFVNGILDRIRIDLERSGKEADGSASQ